MATRLEYSLFAKESGGSGNKEVADTDSRTDRQTDVESGEGGRDRGTAKATTTTSEGDKYLTYLAELYLSISLGKEGESEATERERGRYDLRTGCCQMGKRRGAKEGRERESKVDGGGGDYEPLQSGFKCQREKTMKEGGPQITRSVTTRVGTVQSSPPSPQALNWDWTSVPAILQDLSPQSLSIPPSPYSQS